MFIYKQTLTHLPAGGDELQPDGARLVCLAVPPATKQVVVGIWQVTCERWHVACGR